MTSIQQLVEKIKGVARSRGFRLPSVPDDLFLGLVIILVASGSFGLGRLSVLKVSKTPIRVENAPKIAPETFQKNTPPASNQSASVLGATEGQLVGSKNGTKYHYPWCAGAQKIAETNRVYFTSKDQAEQAGYTPAGNCKGL